MKSRILEMLSQQSGIVSGEAFSEQLGVSRVAVWKHIRKLQELGYAIESTSGGYRLSEEADALFAWEFPARQEQIHYYAELPSTMQTARELARKGCPPFTVVIAERQSEGRGRLGRNWVSEEGGLFFTVVLRPRLAPAHSGRLNLAVATVLAKTLRALYDVPASVKWPNDILVDEKKLVGILSEMEAESDQVSFVNIGIGINVNNQPPSANIPAVSLQQLLGRRVMRKALLKTFLDNLENYLANEDLSRVVEHWKQYTVTLGRQVRVTTQNEIYEGRAIDVADDGALVLQMADGSHQNVIYGDCFHQP